MPVDTSIPRSIPPELVELYMAAMRVTGESISASSLVLAVMLHRALVTLVAIQTGVDPVVPPTAAPSSPFSPAPPVPPPFPGMTPG